MNAGKNKKNISNDEVEIHISYIESILEEHKKQLSDIQKSRPDFCEHFIPDGRLDELKDCLNQLEKLDERISNLIPQIASETALLPSYDYVRSMRTCLSGPVPDAIRLLTFLAGKDAYSIEQKLMTSMELKGKRLVEATDTYNNERNLLSNRALDKEKFLMATELETRKKSILLGESDVDVGDVITFGRYPQTAEGNDQTPIEWRVLEVRNGKVLLISKDGIDCKPYHEKYVNITWEHCSLRKWLNVEFIQKAFESVEQEKIDLTAVPADKNPKYNTTPGNATRDKIFLLSIPEAEKYFNSNKDKWAAPSAYATAQGAYTDDLCKTADGKKGGMWWLRSPGVTSTDAVYVKLYGGGSYGSYFVNSDYYFVRPALWINLESLNEISKNKKMDTDFSEQTASAKKERSESGRTPIIQGMTDVGSIITFGHYPQGDNGEIAPIEWQVLNRQTNKMLLISQYGLECRTYDSGYPNIVTWKNCDLRHWLNRDFLHKTFNQAEQSLIKDNYCLAERNSHYNISAGKSTTDKIFLLSSSEAEKYFNSDDDRKAAPTAYAKKQGAWTGKAFCVWWLRTPGASSYDVMYVDYDGSVHYLGEDSGDLHYFVRPALWVNLES